jgi:hypothetical protein
MTENKHDKRQPRMADYIGKRGFLLGDWRIPIKILDARNAYGRLDLYVAPVNAKQAPVWVSATRIELEE